MAWVSLLLLTAVAGRTSRLAAQSEMTMAETARWLETEGTDIATGTTDQTATTNRRMITYKSSAVLTLHDCRLTIVVSDNSGVNGTQTTLQVPLKEVDLGGVRPVSRPDGYHDFIYIPGQYFVTIPARNIESYPFMTISSRGELRSYLATIPAKDADASRMLTAAVQRAAQLCGAY